MHFCSFYAYKIKKKEEEEEEERLLYILYKYRISRSLTLCAIIIYSESILILSFLVLIYFKYTKCLRDGSKVRKNNIAVIGYRFL